LSSENRFRVPVLDQLIPDGVEAGTVFIVEFDPDSQWLAVATTIAAKYLQANGRVAFVCGARSLESGKKDLAKLGIDVAEVVKERRLVVDDWYSATLSGGRIPGQHGSSYAEPIEGGERVLTLKISELSVEWLRLSKEGPRSFDIAETWPPGALTIIDSHSPLLRFNEENIYLEFVTTRVFPNERKARRIRIGGIVRGVQSDSFYRRLEDASDGIIDLRVIERDDEAKNLLRVRSLKGRQHDTRWHEVQIKSNGETSLVS
jgi:KaiC/GvpD/RAD55 family RecA-like ATPase